MTPDRERDEVPDVYPDVVLPGPIGLPEPAPLAGLTGSAALTGPAALPGFAALPVVPEPHPEVMARVLEGLRDLPPRPDRPAVGALGDPGGAGPLPRRRR